MQNHATARDIAQQVVQLLGTMQTARDIPQQVVQLLGFLLKVSSGLHGSKQYPSN